MTAQKEKLPEIVRSARKCAMKKQLQSVVAIVGHSSIIHTTCLVATRLMVTAFPILITGRMD